MRLVVWIWILVGTCGCVGPSPARIVVVSDLSNRPFAFVDDQGEPAGLEIELVQRIAERIGVGVRWSHREFDELLPACTSGDADVVAATIGITAERGREVLFTRPYYRTRIALVVRSGAGEPASHEALRDRRVRASRGTTSERAVKKRLPQAIVVLAGKDAASIASELESGAIDAAAVDGPDAERLVAASNGSLRELDPLSEEHYAFAIAPRRSQLRVEFDSALREMQASGSLRELWVKYGVAPPDSRAH